LSEDQEWTPVSGAAHVFTYTVVHRGPGRFDDEVPYVIALGRLVEQPRPCLVLASMAGVAADDVAVGMPIEIAYQAIPGEGLTPADIDGVIPLDPAPYGATPSAHMFWAEQLGEKPLTYLDIGLASGGIAKAATAIAAGMADVVVFFWGKAGRLTGPGGVGRAD